MYKNENLAMRLTRLGWNVQNKNDTLADTLEVVSLLLDRAYRFEHAMGLPVRSDRIQGLQLAVDRERDDIRDGLLNR